MISRLRWLALLIALAAAGAQALEVKGVALDGTAQLTPHGPLLVLNGAGVRKKFFFSIYVGALYLPARSHSAQQILAANEPHRVLMHFLYHRVSADELAGAWRDGFADNLSPADFARVKDRLARFSALFGDVVKGDVVLLDYLPATGTRVIINGKTVGTVPGADFNRALLRVWLGSDPASDSLKRAMLGDGQ